MYILGLSCYYHDSAACLIKDGVLIAAASEERFTKVKHDPSFPKNAINFCLSKEGISPSELDHVVFHEKPFLKFDRIARSILSSYPFSFGLFFESLVQWFKVKLWIKSTISEFLSIKEERILFCQHHLSHAASAFFCSPFKEAAILTCDGAGEWQTTTLGKGVSEQLEVAECIDFPHSLGLLYSAFTAFLGFEVNEGEYKVMGMAGFGKPRFIDLVYKTIDVSEDGSFKLNMEYFSFHESESNSFNRRFRGLFGVPRKPDSGFDPSSEQDLRYADIAASIQKVTEDILLKAAIYLKKKSGMRNLCMAGGVALNCVANSRILKESGFDDIYIQPASGDSGAALGAALYAYHCLLKKKKAFVMENAYWGPEFNDTEIKNILHRNGSNYLLLEEEPLLDQVACLLDSQKVVGWFEGRAEWGPRALGNRSILADPRNLEMKQTLNKKIKFREEFRPFSPCILEEKAQEYFDIDVNKGRFALKFMLLTGGAKKKDAIPAAVNVDGTGRVQPVNKVDNPLFYRLLEKFYQRTGMPALINTSFNLKGEPIVNTPEDALNTFFKSGMDALVLGHFLIKKEK